MAFMRAIQQTKASRRTLAATGTLFTVLFLVILSAMGWAYLDRHAFFSDQVRRERCGQAMERIARGKQAYAGLHGTTNGTVVATEDLVEFIEGGWETLKCPAGGTIDPGALGKPAKCTVHGQGHEGGA